MERFNINYSKKNIPIPTTEKDFSTVSTDLISNYFVEDLPGPP